MEIDLYGLIAQLALLIVLLLCSAFFSGSESAIFSLSHLEQDRLSKKTTGLKKKTLNHILSAPDEILITILTGNMIVNVAASTLAEKLGQRFFPGGSELLSIVLMTVLLLLVGEMTPKTLAVRNAVRTVQRSSVILYAIYRVFTPLHRIFSRLIRWLDRRAGDQREALRSRNKRIILSAAQVGFREGMLNQSELDLFESFYHFQNKTAQEVMIHRTSIYGVDLSTSIPELITLFGNMDKPERTSRVPVYDDDIDHLVGYFNLQDLLPYRFAYRSENRLRELVKPFLHVPATKKCTELLQEMRRTDTAMALIVDEYGGTAGIITIESLRKVLFRFFYTDNDATETAPGTFRVPGDMELEILRDILGMEIQGNTRTVSGLITQRLEDIPPEGTRFILGKLEFTPLEVSSNRILWIQVKRLN